MPFRPSSVVLFSLGVLLSSMRLSTSESARVCSGEGFPFVIALESRCPASISPCPPLKRSLDLGFVIFCAWILLGVTRGTLIWSFIRSVEDFKVNGNFVNRLLTSKHQDGYSSVLFYASWCPFSNSVQPIVDALSIIFPQINHVAVEQSSTLPSLFSRYGIHSLPSIILVNATTRTCYHGPKSLQSLIQFYEANTGIKPVQPLVLDPPTSGQAGGNSIKQLSGLLSLKEMTSSEPYLVLSVLFICLRALLIVLPGLLSHLKGLWLSYAPYLKLKIFGETTQIWGRIVQVVDVRRIWTKTRLCKVRSLHERARSARVWASSLASVSLRKSSSA